MESLTDKIRETAEIKKDLAVEIKEYLTQKKNLQTERTILYEASLGFEGLALSDPKAAQYFSKEKKLKSLEEKLFEKISGIFAPEFERLKSELQSEIDLCYSLDCYRVTNCLDGGPGIFLSPPFKKNGEEITEEEKSKLNDFFCKKFTEVEKAYGFIICGFNFLYEEERKREGLGTLQNLSLTPLQHPST